MKYAREIKVGVLSVICLFLLYFGFYFLKGVNIFSPIHVYHGKFVNVSGLTEQSPVYIRGYKVGQVDHISYDFALDSAFLVDISVDKHIRVPKGSEMALVSDGLLGGMAIELMIPVVDASVGEYASESFLPTMVVPGLMDNLQDGLLASLSQAVERVNGVVEQLSSQLDNNHIENVLGNVDNITADLTTTSKDLKRLMHNQVPTMVAHVDSVVSNLDQLSTSLLEADIVGKVDTVVAGVNTLLDDVRSTDGTLGKLLMDDALYNNVNATVQSADSLLVDLKAHPKRYVHFSLFGGRDKND